MELLIQMIQLNTKTLLLMMMPVGPYSLKNKSYVPTLAHFLFQGILIILLLMSLAFARRIRI